MCIIWILFSSQVKDTISNYKLSNRKVGMNCRKMSELLLVKVDSKRVYEADSFLTEQKNHCSKVLGQLNSLYQEIIDIMNATYEVLYGVSPHYCQ